MCSRIWAFANGWAADVRLETARITSFRSIQDSGIFPLDPRLTWIEGANETGKTAVLEALQLIHAATGTEELNPESDFPRTRIGEIDEGSLAPGDVAVVTAEFLLEDADRALLPRRYAGARLRYRVTRYLDNSAVHALEGVPPGPTPETVAEALREAAGATDSAHRGALEALLAEAGEDQGLSRGLLRRLGGWLASLPNMAAPQAVERAAAVLAHATDEAQALAMLEARLPTFILFDRSILLDTWLDLQPIPDRLAPDAVSEWRAPYGNECLLKLLSFDPDTEAEDPGAEEEDEAALLPEPFDPAAFRVATTARRLTRALRSLWGSPRDRPGAERVRIAREGGWVRVTVEDQLGAEVELGQRSDALRYLLSFLIVYFAETALAGRDSILLIDEPAARLDPQRRASLQRLVESLSQRHQTIVLADNQLLPGGTRPGLTLTVAIPQPELGTRVTPAEL
jgi:hypothetical protein